MRPVFEKAILLAETIGGEMLTDGAIRQVGALMHLGLIAQRDLRVNSPATEEVTEFAGRLARVWGGQNLTRRKIFRGIVLSLCTVVESPQVDAFFALFDSACDAIEASELKSIGQELLAAKEVPTDEAGEENETPDDVRRSDAEQAKAERRRKLEDDIRSARQVQILASQELEELNTKPEA